MKVVFSSILIWNKMAHNGIVLNEFSLAVERLQKSHVKTVLIIFVSAARIIHCKFVPEGITVNSHYYIELMERLYTHMCHVKNEYFRNSSWLLLYDNMPSLHIEYEAVSCFQIDLCYPAFPLLARFGTTDFLPPKEKLVLKRQCFSDISDIPCDVI